MKFFTLLIPKSGDSIKKFISSGFFLVLLLIIILAIALFLRIYFPWNSVFQDQVRYASDDGVYHMRLLENLLLGGHFPQRIFFDPFTYFPYGTYIHFAPLYEYPVAIFIWLISLGHPTLELINKITPFYPPVLGTLAVLVVFFIAKKLWGKWAGLASAFFAAISAPLVFRSLLGATDHHQAEYLFSSLAMLFLILAVSNPQGKKFLLWTILSGISLSLYFLAWKGALMFFLLIFLFIFLYYFLEYLAGRSHLWILKAGIIIFTITLVAISLFLNHPDIFHSRLYDARYVASLLGGIAVFLVAGFVGEFLRKKHINRFYFPLVILLLGTASFFITKIVFPNFFSSMVNCFMAVNSGMTPYPLIRQLVGEMAPLAVKDAFDVFSCLFYLSVAVFFFFCWEFIKKRKAEDFLLIVWFLVVTLVTGILVPAIGIGRYAYYLAIVISLFCGFLFVKGLKFAINGLSLWYKQRKEKNLLFLLIGSLLVILNILYFVFYPFPLNLIYSFPDNLPRIISSAINIAQNGAIVADNDWYDTLKWLKENTPDPGLDYYGLYKEPPFDPATGKIAPYSYPETVYGILASWDFGHIITYYSHRLPTANPFQEGIGKIENGKEEPGETTFFAETDEEKACQMLSTLKTRYIISDFRGSYAYLAFPSKLKWADDSLKGYYSQTGDQIVATGKYDHSMAARLQLLDGREFISQEETLPALRHFRLVYESKTPSAFMYGFSTWGVDEIKMVKIFEYVNGARITGEAPTGTEVEISTEVKTNQNREFVWQDRQAIKDGKFEFVVPYAASYEIKIGSIEKKITVSEKEVLAGSETAISI